jgi:hypothetical protein
MRPDGLGEIRSNVRGIRGGDGTVPVRCVSTGALGPVGSYSWQRCRGAVLYNMLRSGLQRSLRHVAWAIHAPNEHIIRRQCQDALTDLPAMHAGSRMVRAEPECPCRRSPGARRRLDEGLRYWREGRGKRTVRHSARGYRRWSGLDTRLPQRTAGEIVGPRFLLRCSVDGRFRTSCIVLGHTAHAESNITV